VPVCLSASHMAFGSIRMEPVFFALGQAAGTAASMAAANGAAVQDVPYGELCERLLADGQVVGKSAKMAQYRCLIPRLRMSANVRQQVRRLAASVSRRGVLQLPHVIKLGSNYGNTLQ